MLTPKTTIELLDACTAGSPPKLTKWGSLPMNGQISCEGPQVAFFIIDKISADDIVCACPVSFIIIQGKTSLFEEPTGPGFMMRTDLEKKVDPASVKEHMHY